MKFFWQILNSITITLFVLVMLIFFNVLSLDYVFLPILFSSIFLTFFILIQFHLSNAYSTLLFFAIALSVSLIYDKLLIINNLYDYNSNFIHFHKMPIAALFTWAAAISQSYHFQNGFLYALKMDKPTFQKKEFLKLFLLMLLDGLHLLTIGFMMEYLIVQNGFGTWLAEAKLELFDLPILQVLSSYFLVGFVGSGIYRLFEFFTNKAKLKSFNGYLNIFHLVYLVCFFISLYVLYNVNFSPIFAFISIIMLVILLINNRIHRGSK